jgi:hypothetical protein
MKVLVNEELASAAIAATEDVVVRDLLKLGYAATVLRVARLEGETDDEWSARVPQAPIDMNFLVEVLRATFSQKDVLKKVLEGHSIADASGWTF